MKTCETCKYCKTGLDYPHAEKGECRRFPPTKHGETINIGKSGKTYRFSFFLYVDLDDWCGEHADIITDKSED